MYILIFDLYLFFQGASSIDYFVVFMYFQECPRGAQDFREEQCAALNGRHFNMNGIPMDVEWVPKYDGGKSRS